MGCGKTYPNLPLCVPQNGGNLLCAVDESNDHVLSVWDWAKESKVVDSKVGGLAALQVSSWDMLHCMVRNLQPDLNLNSGFGIICWMTGQITSCCELQLPPAGNEISNGVLLMGGGWGGWV